MLAAREPGGCPGAGAEVCSQLWGDTFKPNPKFNCIRMWRVCLLPEGTWPRHTHTASRTCGQLLWLHLETFLWTLQSATACSKAGKGSDSEMGNTSLSQHRMCPASTTGRDWCTSLLWLCKPQMQHQGLPSAAIRTSEQKALLSLRKSWKEPKSNPLPLSNIVQSLLQMCRLQGHSGACHFI